MKQKYNIDDFRVCECSHCDGTGRTIDPVLVGEHMRSLRETSGLTVIAIAKRLKLSRIYIYDLEQGRRAWRKKLFQAYVHHCLMACDIEDD